MKCSNCYTEYDEKDIQESHDVPCYLFKGFNRNDKKNQADKYTRRWLCKRCHETYEEELRQVLINIAQSFGVTYFK